MYKAKAIVVNDIRPHPNADKLNLVYYGSEVFVVGKDLKVGELVVLFPSDGQLSHEFCKNNNLYRDASKNKDRLKSGFFEDSRRVRVQPFRGVKSMGFLAGVSMFSYLGKVSLSAGDEFDTINGQEICRKYYTPKTLAAMSKIQQKKIKNIEYLLKEHLETDKWAYSKPIIETPTLVTITEKVHGTSARTGYTKVIRRNVNLFQKIISFLTRKVYNKESYELVSGTRRTIINQRLDITTPGQTDNYRWEWHNKISQQLHVGETIFYEIVGWDSLGGTIMERQELSKIKKEGFTQPTWKNPMTFSYGLPEGQNDVLVYRITQTSHDGTETELSWFGVEKRCRELGLKTVPVLERFITYNTEQVDETVNKYMDDRSSILDERHISEGICIRLENSDMTKIYKLKNYLFLYLEGVLKDSSNYIDNEEIN